jgi:crotonobetainyl-CoA:carnitine CoA-transferase CaiB-like acyl-CoA transferase
VLSLGMFVAGNTAATLLADLGADVVKIEGRDRPDVLRTPAYAIGDSAVEPSGVPVTVMHASLVRGLRNLSLDMGSSAGRALFRRLVSECEVVLENFGKPVLERWGCGFEDLLVHRPSLVMLSLTGYGRRGPRANYLAYGKTIAPYLGLSSTWGYAHGTLTDYLTGATGALAAVAAVIEARRSGTPAHLDVAQIDAVAPMLAALYASPLNVGHDDVPIPNRAPGSWLSGIVPSRGHDAWLAVDIEDGDDWNTLCTLLERPDLSTGDRRAADAAGPELFGALAAWASRCSAYTGMHHLQRAGLAAAVVQDEEDVWRDLQLQARRFAEVVDQPDLGPVTYTGSPQRWSATPGRAPVPPARLGQHSRDVLRGWLGLDTSELADLEAAGVVFSAGAEGSAAGAGGSPESC